MKLTVQQIVQQMVSAGVHFGHRRCLRNPKMIPYIYTEKDDLQIIDLLQTYWYLQIASKFLFDACRRGQRILFVGTKKHIAKCVEQTANECHSWYINKRWLGGLLTNWETMRKSILKLQTENRKAFRFTNSHPQRRTHREGDKQVDSRRQAAQRPALRPRRGTPGRGHARGAGQSSFGLDPISMEASNRTQQQANGTKNSQKLKKENARLERQKKRLLKYLGGVQTMSELPDVVIIIGQQEEMNAVRECQKLKIPNLTILDTNCDPSFTDFFIPANDDSLTSVHFILSKLANAIKEGQKDFQLQKKKKKELIKIRPRSSERGIQKEFDSKLKKFKYSSEVAHRNRNQKGNG